MTDALFLVSSVAVTVIGLLLIGFMPSEKKAGANALLVFVNAILTSIPAFHVLFNQPIALIIPDFSFFGDIAIRIDALSGLVYPDHQLHRNNRCFVWHRLYENLPGRSL